MWCGGGAACMPWLRAAAAVRRRAGKAALRGPWRGAHSGAAERGQRPAVAQKCVQELRPCLRGGCHLWLVAQSAGGEIDAAEHAHLTAGVKRLIKSVKQGLKACQVCFGVWVGAGTGRASLVLLPQRGAGRLRRTGQPGKCMRRGRARRRCALTCRHRRCVAQEPEAATEGLGGTYFFMNDIGKKIAIFKPCDEEPLAPNNPKGFVGRQLGDPGLKPTVRVGEAATREVGGAGAGVAGVVQGGRRAAEYATGGPVRAAGSAPGSAGTAPNNMVEKNMEAQQRPRCPCH